MITIKDLYFSYTPSSPYILDDINLHIHRGDYISIVGENGCGKSTLLRLILGLLPPTKGQIHTSTTNWRYVSQQRDAAMAGFPITVEETINGYRHILGISDKGEVERVLNLTGMITYRHRLIHHLSGGQQQRALIGRALLGHPDVLILDEPSTGVDRVNQQEIYGLLKQLNNKEGLTIVSVEHNLDAAIANSTNIFHIVNGHGHLCSPQQYGHEILHHPAAYGDCEVCHV